MLNLTNEQIVLIFIGCMTLGIVSLPFFFKIYQKQREIINYLIVGVLTTLVSLIIYYSLVYTILNPDKALELQIANVISWIISVLFAYVTNRKFVFQSTNRKKGKEFISFVSARILTLIMDMLIMYFGVTLLKGNDKIWKIVSQIIVIISNYILSKLFVFKKDKN